MKFNARVKTREREIRIARSKMHFRRLRFQRWTIITKVIRPASAFYILAKCMLLAIRATVVASPRLARLGKQRRRVEKHRCVCNAPAIAPLDYSLFHFFPFLIVFDPLLGNLYPPIRENPFPLLPFKHTRNLMYGESRCSRSLDSQIHKREEYYLRHDVNYDIHITINSKIGE